MDNIPIALMKIVKCEQYAQETSKRKNYTAIQFSGLESTMTNLKATSMFLSRELRMGDVPFQRST